MKNLILAAALLGGCTMDLAGADCLAELEADGIYTPDDAEDLDVRCPGAETGFTDRRGNGNNPSLSAFAGRVGNGNNAN